MKIKQAGPLAIGLLAIFGTITGLEASLATSQAAQDANSHARMEAPLRNAGIDPNSTDALLAALAHKSDSVKTAAVLTLWRKRETRAVPQLQKLLNSKGSLLRLTVCQALADLGAAAEIWKPTAIKLLNTPTLTTRLRAARLLAQHGDPRGWQLVKTGLASRQPGHLFEAVQAAPAFDGQESATPAGKQKIAVLPELLAQYQKADPASQLTLFGGVVSIAKPAHLPELKAFAAVLDRDTPGLQAKRQKMTEEAIALRNRDDLTEQEKNRLFNEKFPDQALVGQQEYIRQQLAQLIQRLEAQ